MRPFAINEAQQANHDEVPKPASMTPRQQLEAGPETVKGATEAQCSRTPGFSRPEIRPGDLDWRLI